MNKLDKEISNIKLWFKDEDGLVVHVTQLGSTDDFESVVSQIKQSILKAIINKAPKKDMEHVSYTGSFCFGYDKFQDYERQKEDWDRGIARNKALQEFESVIKELLGENK